MTGYRALEEGWPQCYSYGGKLIWTFGRFAIFTLQHTTRVSATEPLQPQQQHKYAQHSNKNAQKKQLKPVQPLMQGGVPDFMVLELIPPQQKPQLLRSQLLL